MRNANEIANELGRINEALRAELWREALEARKLRINESKRWDSLAFSLAVLAFCTAVGIAAGAYVAIATWREVMKL